MGKNSLGLLTDYPQAFSFWHPTFNGDVDATKLPAGSGKTFWWKCGSGHEFEARLARVVSGQSGCPYCSGRFAIPGETDLFTLFPAIAAEFDAVKNTVPVDSVVPTSWTKYSWVCQEGHEWVCSVNERTQKNKQCTVCSGRTIVAGVNDLGTLRPDLAAQWHPTKNTGVELSTLAKASRTSVWWVCSRGHEWEALVYARTSNSSGCPVCSGRVAEAGVSDLVTTLSDVAKEWHPTKNLPLLPSAITSGSNVSVWWQCAISDKHVWQAPLYSRRAGHGCPVCSNQKVLAGENDLLTVRPDIATLWHPTKNGTKLPSEVSVRSGTKAFWQCPVKPDHEWEATIASQTGGSGCPKCASALSVSAGETQVGDFLESLGFAVVRSDRSVLGNRQEVDVYLPDRKFAVEFNGLYWHSERFRDKAYHADKLAAARAVGVQLVQVWEDDWRDRRSIVMRGLAHRLGVVDRLLALLPDAPASWFERVGARSCEVVRLSHTEAADFLLDHHVQGPVNGSLYAGLRSKAGVLVAVMVVSWVSKTRVLRIDRYASSGVIPGGFTRLLKFVEGEFAPDEVVTFADLTVSDGGLYESHGFVVDKVIPADYSYVVGGCRVHKFNYRVERFKSDPLLVWVDGASESMLAELNGLSRIWDAGKIRYVKRFV